MYRVGDRSDLYQSDLPERTISIDDIPVKILTINVNLFCLISPGSADKVWVIEQVLK